MRYVIYGAGAVGGVIGGCLSLAGRDVHLLARGAHLRALRSEGLRLDLVAGSHRLPLPADEDPADVHLVGGDVVVLSMKTQDTEAALRRLEAVAPPDVVIVCAQNGVENERLALRRFSKVLGMAVMLPGALLEPGVVEGAGTPVPGVLDVGPVGTWIDGPAVAAVVAADLEAAGFRSRADPSILRFKYAKLRMNVSNALDALCGRSPETDGAPVPDDSASAIAALAGRARAEVDAVYVAAGIDVASKQEWGDRRGEFRATEIAGRLRPGSSSWQSLARGVGSIEADHLNGEIVLLGRLYGVATPVNETLRRLANSMAVDRRPPGSLTAAEVETAVAIAGGG